ncbi:MAG: hypothetical protein WCS01_10655 [bacterium]
MAVQVRVKLSRLRHRLDAMYYHPRFLANEERLTRSGTARRQVRELVSGGRRAVYFGTTTHERESAPSTWVPFLTADDLGDDGFYLDQSPRRLVSPEFAARYPNGWLRPNEILVKVKGPNQIAAYNPATSQFRTLVSGTLWGALVRNNVVDAHFLLTALSCPYAAMARERLRTNTNVEFLAAEDLLALELPYLNETRAQTYIGDKVRQAERLRECARLREAKIDDHFRVLTSSLPPPRKAWTVGASIVESYRLNAGHYDAMVLGMLDNAAKISNLVPLGDIVGDRGIKGGATPLGADYPNEGVFFVRVQNVRPYRLDLGDSAYIDAETDKILKRSRCANGDIILGITGYPGTASLVMDEDLPVNINQHSVRFNTDGSLTPEYVTAAINSAFVQKQVDRLAIGGTRDALDYPSVRNLQIPVLGDAIVQEVTKCVSVANAAVRASSRLTTAAKHLVEVLIDGKVTETDLVQAQEALERHDRGPERALLARLTAQGMDVPDAKPLFPDLDKLYALLDQDDGESPGGDAQGT